MKKVLLINQGWTDNIGDQAINNALQALLEKENCEVTCYGFTTNEPYDIFRVEQNNTSKNSFSAIKKFLPQGFKWTLKQGIPNVIKFLRTHKKDKYDLVIIGGGQLILSNSMFAYALMLWYLASKFILKCPIAIFSVGAGNEYNTYEKKIYNYVLKRCDDIYLRDQKSINNISEIYGINAKYVPDVAFTYQDIISTEYHQSKSKTALVCIYEYSMYSDIVSSGINEDDYMELWANRTIELAKQGYQIKLGYTTFPDKQQTIKLYKYLSDNYSDEIECILVDNDTLETFIKEIQNAEVIYTGRMHGMILGLCYGCKIIPFIFTQKLATFNDEYLTIEHSLKETQKVIKNRIKNLVSHSVN